jgi:hypothetical protein
MTPVYDRTENVLFELRRTWPHVLPVVERLRFGIA